MAVMTQSDIDQQDRLGRLPAAIAAKARTLDRSISKRTAATTDRENGDRQHPAWVNPPMRQRLGYHIRVAVYPANLLAELTAGAASAMYVAYALWKVDPANLWMAPLVFAPVALVAELFLAHAREAGRNELGRAPLGWTMAAITLLIALVGLQFISQYVDTITPVIAGEPRRLFNEIDWYEWGRMAFFGALLGILHIAVLFGGRAQEDALAYAAYRAKRRCLNLRVRWHGMRAEREMSDFGRLVTAYEADRSGHAARGFDPGHMPAFDPVTREMLQRLATQAALSSGATASSSRAPSTADTVNTTQPPPQAQHDGTPTMGATWADAHDGVERENEFLRATLDARTRNDDGEVRPGGR